LVRLHHAPAIDAPPDSPAGPPPVRFAGHVKSDQLADLARLLGRIEPFRSGTTLVQATLILDANIIIAELIWLCQRRKKSDARSTLLELVECSTVKAYAPTYLATEIEDHFATLQTERGLSPVAAREAWERFRPRITFVEVGGPDPSFPGVTDPKDVPYVRLHQQISVPVVSSDDDLARMGATVIQIQLFAPLKAYSRQRAVEYQIKVVGLGAVFAAGLATRMAIEGAKAAAAAIGNLPKPVLAAAAIGALIAVIHPDSRRWILERLDGAAEIGGKVASGLYDVLMPVVQEHYAAKLAADEGLASVEALLTQLGIPPASVLNARVVALKKPRKARKPHTRPKTPALPAPA
jgi:hypothetical protein